MFQYAAGRALSLHHRVPLKLDISSLNKEKNRSYRLGYFNIREDFADGREIARIEGNRVTKGLFRLAEKYGLRRRKGILKESCLKPFTPSIFDMPKQVLLDGYWQTEKYFASCKEIIQKEFTLKNPPCEASAALAERIKKSDSVAVHVRRGDYVTDAGINRVHGTCETGYYEQCLAHFTKQPANPVFFVFSDDPEWVEKNFPRAFAAVEPVGNTGGNDYEDLWLMSLCKHNITANSSFSWWAAWLNRNPGKIVLAPGNWFRDRACDTRDLFPPGWRLY
jgi:hypothetical protein